MLCIFTAKIVERRSRYAMLPLVAQFLDDNKAKHHLKSGFTLCQTSSILVNFIQFVKCWRNFLGIRKDCI